MDSFVTHLQPIHPQGHLHREQLPYLTGLSPFYLLQLAVEEFHHDVGFEILDSKGHRHHVLDH